MDGLFTKLPEEGYYDENVLKRVVGRIQTEDQTPPDCKHLASLCTNWITRVAIEHGLPKGNYEIVGYLVAAIMWGFHLGTEYQKEFAPETLTIGLKIEEEKG